jgi:hypothetical protein
MENHRYRHGAQMGSIVMPRARRTWAARRGAVRPGADGARKTSLTVYSKHTRISMPGDVISLDSPVLGAACNGSGETTSVIDTINRRARFKKSQLSGTYPYSSKQSNPALLHAIRLQLRCNPDRRRNVRTRFFHRICMPAGPMERAPV